MSRAYAWWQREIIYQIYPRSFQDSNGDGVGDLRGILSRVDYLTSLNVGAIWLSPIYPSPMHDFGYDVADYCAIDPRFGTMADFNELLVEIHRRGMRLIVDLVPNHTSDEHPWFVESRRDGDNAKSDWYIWRDPAPGGGLPNNWLSHFGGPAWTFDERRGQYYMHQFARQQPELNYRNPEVFEALLEVMRFWLDRGVDGFRVDVISLLLKDPLFRDEPPNPAWDGVRQYASLRHIHTGNLPEVHGLIRRMRALLDSRDARMMVGEVYLPNAELMRFYGGPEAPECHLPFNFQLISTPWQAGEVRAKVDAYEAALPPGAWPNWVLGNHDQHRLATRVGLAQARVATMLLLTLRGTPTCYYGDEIGLRDVALPRECWRDPVAINQPQIAHLLGRDPERTPMQWDSSANAGFAAAGVLPWLPVAGDHRTVNVAAESADPQSILSFFRALTALRRSEPALGVGAYRSIDAVADDVYAYLRSDGESRLLVVLNFAGGTRRLTLPRGLGDSRILLSTTCRLPEEAVVVDRLQLGPDEGIVLRLAEGPSGGAPSPA
ncbi:alpha-amylase family glycosyl hydrolase [Accumulibacter sp.]|uniref:alpha-amylase family glycosyl hydrolase n=1 Tax=Accumulibacter sp. TaxID=2053492 RepID=UPI0025D77BED|nr:alpha-amylase family glycosyl hydrolase [Accumulibacter sp.]MCM8626712.1 alpha-amylase family glycosyl hydrolase [Accumulibacter sp.]